jgi:hypothetical protein
MVSIRKSSTKVFLSLLIATSSSYSSAGDLKKRIITKVVPATKSIYQYVDEVKATGGRRIFSVPADARIRSSPYSMWFRTPNLSRGYFTRGLQFIPMRLTERWPGGPYEFTPLKTMESLTWGNFTEKTFGIREQFSRPVKFASGLVLSVLVYMGATAWLEHATVEKLMADIETHKDFYDFFLNNDYRCRDIKLAVLDNGITPKEGRIVVYKEVQSIYSRWFSNREFNISKSVQYFRKTLVDFPLFYPLKNVVTDGLKPTIGFAIDPSHLGPLTDGQIRQLFSQTDHLAIKEEFITRAVKAPFNLEDDIDPRLFTSDLRSEILDDPFNRELFDLNKSGKISIGDLVYGLQENEAWKTEYEHYDTLHVVRLTYNSDKPIALEEIQKEIKIDVLSHGQRQIK